MKSMICSSRYVVFTLFLTAAFLGGCKKTDSTPVETTPAPTHASGTYTGVLADSGQSGTITLSIPASGAAFAKAEGAAAIDTVTGSVTLGTNTFNLTGTYNTSNDSLYLIGSSGAVRFSFAGTFSGGVLQGTWSDSQGDTGSFAAASGSSAAVLAYIGITTSASGHNPAQIDLAVKGSTLIGVALIANQRQLFTGTVSGNAITLYYTIASVKTKIGSGTFDSTHITASGAYNLAGVDSGTWAVINSAYLPPPLHASGAYAGVLASAHLSGKLTLSVSASSNTVVSATGSFVLNSATTNLSGTYNTSNDSLRMTGASNGNAYSFAGVYADGYVLGSWTIAGGDSGDFAAIGGSGRRVTSYLGNAYGEGEPFDFVVNGSRLAGVGSIAGLRQAFIGSVNGSAIALFAGTDPAAVNVGSGTIAQGRATASGSYSFPGVGDGIWAVTQN